MHLARCRAEAPVLERRRPSRARSSRVLYPSTRLSDVLTRILTRQRESVCVCVCLCVCACACVCVCVRGEVLEGKERVGRKTRSARAVSSVARGMPREIYYPRMIKCPLPLLPASPSPAPHRSDRQPFAKMELSIIATRPSSTLIRALSPRSAPLAGIF